jgi:DNA replication protein DnaC
MERKPSELTQHPEWATALDKARRCTKSGGILLLLGDRGTGKTQLACELARLVCRDEPFLRELYDYGGVPLLARYARVDEVGMEVREVYQTKSRTERQALARFIQPRLLVIDECQELPDREWERRLLGNIIDRRYSQTKPTVLIANSDAEAVLKLFGPSVVDRIKEGGGQIVCDWRSFRG